MRRIPFSSNDRVGVVWRVVCLAGSRAAIADRAAPPATHRHPAAAQTPLLSSNGVPATAPVTFTDTFASVAVERGLSPAWVADIRGEGAPGSGVVGNGDPVGLLDALFSAESSDIASGRMRPGRLRDPHPFPNMEEARLAVEKVRHDALFDAVFDRHAAMTASATASRMKSKLSARDGAFSSLDNPQMETIEQSHVMVHTLIKGRQVNTAIDAAKTLALLLVSAAEQVALRQCAATGGHVPLGQVLSDAACVQAVLHQAFLSAFFLVELDAPRSRGRGVGRQLPSEYEYAYHPELAQLLSRAPCYSAFPYRELFTADLREAMELCLSRLLLASPFSFHVAFEYLVRRFGRAGELIVPLVLFDLWWVVNPDQVPLEVSLPTGARILPSTFTDTRVGSTDVYGQSVLLDWATLSRRERVARAQTYKEGVMKKLSTQLTVPPADVPRGSGLSPDAFFPLGQEAAYARAVASAGATALINGEAKYTITSPLVPRVVMIATRLRASELGGGRRHQSSDTATTAPLDTAAQPSVGLSQSATAQWRLDLVHRLVEHAIIPLCMACSQAASSLEAASREQEGWLTLITAMCAAGVLDGNVHELRRLPRKGIRYSVGDSTLKECYEGRMAYLRRFIASMSSQLTRPGGYVLIPKDAGEGGVHGAVVDATSPAAPVPLSTSTESAESWAKMVFAIVASSYELSGVLSPSVAHRPLTMSDVWRRIHHGAVQTFPHIFHAGSSAVATLLVLAALESLRAGEGGGGGAGLPGATCVGRELALSRFARSVLAGEATGGCSHRLPLPSGETWGMGETAPMSQQNRLKMASNLLSRTVGVAEEEDPLNGDGGGGHGGRGQSRGRLSPVDYAAKDILYPAHSAASGCGGAHTSSASALHGSEALVALEGVRTAAEAIAREHFLLPMLNSVHAAVEEGRQVVSRSTSAGLKTDESTQTAYLLRAKPSFFVLLKLLQVLAVVGEDERWADPGARPPAQCRLDAGNRVAACAVAHVLPHAHHVVGGYVGKLVVQSLLRSSTNSGAVLLLTRHRDCLDVLTADAAWEVLVNTLLWSGLPLEAADQLTSSDDVAGGGGEGEADGANRDNDTTPRACSDSPAVFGAGSLAWRVIENDLATNVAAILGGSRDASAAPAPAAAEDGGEKSPGQSRTADEPLTRPQALARAAKCIYSVLEHIVALAYQLPPGSQTFVFPSSTFLSHPVTPVADPLPSEHLDEQVDPQRGGGDDDGADDDDFNHYQYLEEDAGDGATGAWGAPHDEGEGEVEAVVEAAVLPDLADDLAVSSSRDGRAAFPFVATGEDTAIEGAAPADTAPLHGSDAATTCSGTVALQAKKRMTAPLSGCHPAAQHLFLSFLELVGALLLPSASVPLADEASEGYCRTPTCFSPAHVACGYRALTTVFAVTDSDVSADVGVWGVDGTRVVSQLRTPLLQPRATLKLIQMLVHTCPDVELLLALLRHRHAAIEADAAGEAHESGRGRPLLPKDVVGSLCMLLLQQGITASSVREWARLNAVAHTSCKSDIPNRASERDQTMHLAWMVLEALQPLPQQQQRKLAHPPAVIPVRFDTRDASICEFLELQKKGTDVDASVGVVLPSQQLVRFTASAGSAPAVRAQSWPETWRRAGVVAENATPTSSSPLGGAQQTRAALNHAMDVAEDHSYMELFRD